MRGFPYLWPMAAVLAACSEPPATAQPPAAITAPAAPAAGNFQLGERLSPAKPGQAASTPGAQTPTSARLLSWEALLPAGWDPAQFLKGLDYSTLEDSDPRAMAALETMRKAWEQAPVNNELAGQLVRLPGFVVPLEKAGDQLIEFLLVPYFGACVHTPPPPANQIIHVRVDKPVAGFRSMDPVWVEGVITIDRHTSWMGTSGYRMTARLVEPYRDSSR